MYYFNTNMLYYMHFKYITYRLINVKRCFNKKIKKNNLKNQNFNFFKKILAVKKTPKKI